MTVKHSFVKSRDCVGNWERNGTVLENSELCSERCFLWIRSWNCNFISSKDTLILGKLCLKCKRDFSVESVQNCCFSLWCYYRITGHFSGEEVHQVRRGLRPEWAGCTNEQIESFQNICFKPGAQVKAAFWDWHLCIWESNLTLHLAAWLKPF